MLIVIALGGNALLQRGEPLSSDYLIKNTILAAKSIAQVAKEHKVLIVHGNGPQVGLLALQSEAYKKVPPYPFDILVAESQGMIGYPLQQSLANNLYDKEVVTLLTRIIVSKKDTAFQDPTKFVGPVYEEEQAKRLQKEKGWIVKRDGEFWRRVVPSPKPLEVIEIDTIKSLINKGTIVIAGGGGGIPCVKDADKIEGVEAVIDKDLAAALIAKKLGADKLIILTDVDAVYENYGTKNSKALRNITVSETKQYNFPAGSMKPKIEAICDFVEHTGHNGNIGQLDKLIEILQEQSGTLIKK